MHNMIDGLLEYSRIETRGDPFEPVDLDDVLDDVRENLQMRIDESNAEITADDLPCVDGDVSQLRQVLQNLLSNAIEYSGDEPPQVDISATRDDERWLISVQDTGIGIDPDEQERIFEVFQRLHTYEEHSGTGIGLALSQRVVERHGGEIWVDSEPGGVDVFVYASGCRYVNYPPYSPAAAGSLRVGLPALTTRLASTSTKDKPSSVDVAVTVSTGVASE